MRRWTAAALALLGGMGATLAAESPECAVSAYLAVAEYPLPRVAAAADQAKRLDIAVVGAGSSTLAGPGGVDLAYPARLEVILGERLPGVKTKVITNVKPRRTAAEMAEGFEKILMEDKPVLVIWQSGTVDAITGADPEDYRATLDDGVDALHAGGADVILMNMQYSPRTESMIAIQAYADNMRLVSQQREVPLLDRFAIMRNWNESGTFDLTAATKKLETAARIHDCLAQLLANLIDGGIKLRRDQLRPIQ
jgi:ABC-type amino acid transport substrate-binding protein